MGRLLVAIMAGMVAWKYRDRAKEQISSRFESAREKLSAGPWEADRGKRTG